MKVHLVNPSDTSFGTAVITPRWLYVLAQATPKAFGDPEICDETLESLDPARIQPGDAVGIGIHTGNALRGYAIGRIARARGAFVIFGGIHATLYPQEALELGHAHSVVKGDGDLIWAEALQNCLRNSPRQIYEGGRVEPEDLQAARWDLLPKDRYMWASVQTVRGCAKHCSFCSVWRTDGQRPRQRTVDVVIQEVVELRRLGFRFIALADDNFYPVSLTDLKLAERQGNQDKLRGLQSIRNERFELMERLAELPRDLTFYTQITMEAAEDITFLKAMKKAKIRGALVGVEAVTPEGLKAVFKDFNLSGDALVQRLKTFHAHGVHVLGSFIFGLPDGSRRYFRSDAAVGGKIGTDVCSVRDADAVCRYGRLREVGEIVRRKRPDGRRHADHPVLADPAGIAAQDVHGASDHEFRRNARADPGSLGSFLQHAIGLEAVALCFFLESATGIRFRFETVPADVCEHRHFDR